MDWPRLVRKYVWDEERTPYLVRASRLTARQARSELFVYAFLLALLAAVVAVIAIGDRRLGLAASSAVSAYALTVLGTAVTLGTSGYPGAAAYCATAPIVTGLAAVTGVLRPDMAFGEIVVLTAASVLWLGYAARIVRIARRLRGWD